MFVSSVNYIKRNHLNDQNVSPVPYPKFLGAIEINSMDF